MPAIEVFDTVVLKENRKLVGIVDRTHYENNEPLQDILIVAHVQVDLATLTEFMNTGTPPKNYIFVRFSDEAQGNSLVHENDVLLLDRSFNLGDVVKRENDHMLGTVTSISETYVLQPVWLHHRGLDGIVSVTPTDLLMHDSSHVCSSDCPFGVLSDVEHVFQNCLLYDIPGEELKKAEDILEADWVIQDDWVGIVEELELIVIVLLDDESVVVVKEPDELYIPVEDSGKPLVSLPEFDNLARPDPLVALQGWSATIPPHDFQCGQLVITNHKNLRLGRWLRGQYNASVKPQGRILDVRTKALDVRWLACNAFIPEQSFSIDRPPSRISLYENVNTFPKRSELRSNKRVTVYDHGRLPRIIESRTRKRMGEWQQTPSIHLPTDFRVGDHVKFREQAGAALKYQGVTSEAGICHGKFDRIASADTFGFDVNELKIIRSQQQCTVLWQNGTLSTQSSKTMMKFSLFEPELAPADMVVAREGMKQTLESYGPDLSPDALIDFNEMTFFEKPHDLVPDRVGIVQSVDQSERIAQVRWFVEPKMCLTSYGHVLSSSSRLGPLSQVTEDVSLYEIMTFPALVHRLKDLVIIPPGVVSESTLDIMKRATHSSFHTVGQTSLSHIGSTGGYELLPWFQTAALGLLQNADPPRVVDDLTYKLHPTPDWVGEIVELGLDGSVTVRLNTRLVCKDVKLEHDQLICIIDEAAISGTDLINITSNDMDMDLSEDLSDDPDTASIISETVEYEGGERIDNDSGDENWEDADDDEDVIMDEDVPLIPSARKATSARAMSLVERSGHELIDEKSKDASDAGDKQQLPKPNAKPSLSALRSNLPSLQPPSFSILDRPPPADQYQNPTETFTSYPSFLKRVAREQRILASSLPEGKIFVRTYETRLDLMRCLILGPADTPYEHAPFVIDLQLPKNFPKEPPLAFFHSWTSGLGRINPNLYEEGKICLSLLGTWPGKAENEGWSEKATILQLLVSLQGLVFVRNPFYNEAGFEGYAEDKAYRLESQRYNEKAYVMAREFVKHAVTAPVQGLEDALAWTYLPHDNDKGLLQTVISRSFSLIENSEKAASEEALVDGMGSPDRQTQVFLRLLSRGAIVMLRKTIQSLENLGVLDAASS